MKWYLKCLNQYVDFSGRARRKEYWMFCLYNLIISFIVGFIDGFLGLGVLSIIYCLGIFLPGFAVCVRRLHDIGKSGWYILVTFIPIIGAIVMLIWLCKEGERSSNEWGPDPKNYEY